jgi:hypothetical protein
MMAPARDECNYVIESDVMRAIAHVEVRIFDWLMSTGPESQLFPSGTPTGLTNHHAKYLNFKSVRVWNFVIITLTSCCSKWDSLPIRRRSLLLPL